MKRAVLSILVIVMAFGASACVDRDASRRYLSSQPFEANLNVHALPFLDDDGNPVLPPIEGERGKALHRWNLSIPAEYIYKTSGENGAVSYTEGGRMQTIQLFVLADVEAMEFRPLERIASGQGDGFMSLRISNSNTSKKFVEEPRCLNSEQYENLVTTRSVKKAVHCSEPTKYCTFTMHLEGWVVRASYAREYYNNPAPVCAAAKKFLDNMTVHRDPLAGQ